MIRQIDDIALDGNPELATAPGPGRELHEVAQVCRLKNETENGHSFQGVDIGTLAPFDTITVRTANSCYRIFLLDPETGRALFDGGRHILEPVEARVVGSSLNGSILWTGWLAIGRRLEACTNDAYIRTSPVESISIEHQASF